MQVRYILVIKMQNTHFLNANAPHVYCKYLSPLRICILNNCLKHDPTIILVFTFNLFCVLSLVCILGVELYIHVPC